MKIPRFFVLVARFTQDLRKFYASILLRRTKKGRALQPGKPCHLYEQPAEEVYRGAVRIRGSEWSIEDFIRTGGEVGEIEEGGGLGLGGVNVEGNVNAVRVVGENEREVIVVEVGANQEGIKEKFLEALGEGGA